MKMGKHTSRRSGSPKRLRTFRSATSVDWPTYTPSSFFTREALLQMAPISMAFLIAGDTVPVYGIAELGSRKMVSSTEYASVTVCSFLVNVPANQLIFFSRSRYQGNKPVLSEQITDTDPRDSTEWSFFTIAFRLAILKTPNASVTVVTIGRPSGMAATASDTRGRLQRQFVAS